MGLRATGIFGVLIKAKRNKKISSLETIIKELKEKAGFWISNELYRKVLKEDK